MFKLVRLITFVLVSYSFGMFSQTIIKGYVFDKENRQALAFASVYLPKQHTGTITNEDGYFEIKSTEVNPLLSVSYLGYSELRKYYNNDSLFFLKKINYLINEVDVIDLTGNQIAEIINKIRKKSQKSRDSKIESKALIRTYTLRNDTMVELKETLYSVEQNVSGIKKAFIKNGKIAVLNKVNYFSLDITKSYASKIDIFKQNKNKVLNIESPLNIAFKKEMLNNYNLSYTKLNDSISLINFTNKDSISKGKIYYNSYTYELKKFVSSQNFKKHFPFRSINPEKSIINEIHNFNIDFKNVDNQTTISLFCLNMEQTIKTNKKTDTIKTNYIVHFFDFNNPYSIPVYGIKRDFNDYEGIVISSYIPELWSDNLLKLTGEEKHFFGQNVLKIKDLSFFRYIAVQPTFVSKINWKLLKTQKPNELKIDISFYCNYYKTNGKYNFDVKALFDYYNSYFSFKIDEKANDYLTQIFRLANENAKELKNKLLHKFENQTVVTERDVKKVISEQIRKFQHQKRNYTRKHINLLTTVG